MLKKTLFYISAAAVTLPVFGSGFLDHASAAGITGKVLETMNGAGYTYMHIDSGSVKQWVAIPETAVETGATITCEEGMVMNNFHSKSFDRTFDTIIFSAGLANGPTASAEKQGQVMPAKDNSFASAVAKEQQSAASAAAPTMTTASGGSTGAVVPLGDIKVEKAGGESSYTVEEIYKQAKELNGKSVRVRGKVVKFSPNIMGRNWLHIQDGTGNPMNNSHDLVVTSSESVEQGQVVVVQGTLAAEKDFGAGYKYNAIIEQASVSQ